MSSPCATGSCGTQSLHSHPPVCNTRLASHTLHFSACSGFQALQARHSHHDDPGGWGARAPHAVHDRVSASFRHVHTLHAHSIFKSHSTTKSGPTLVGIIVVLYSFSSAASKAFFSQHHSLTRGAAHAQPPWEHSLKRYWKPPVSSAHCVLWDSRAASATPVGPNNHEPMNGRLPALEHGRAIPNYIKLSVDNDIYIVFGHCVYLPLQNGQFP